ncbi:conserved hypothetical protein, secreted [Beggiatoa sp. PS]|nr:conserved hypothetical protein, secreted [Beggiatoa sp. PS]
MAINSHKLLIKIFGLFSSFVYVLFLIISPPIAAASFNCSKAHTVIKKTICSNTQLNKADEQLGKIYKQLRNSLPKWKFDTIKKEQRQWLKQRNFNCSDGNVYCLQSMNELRIIELRAEIERRAIQSPSFDCAKARTVVEKSICRNNQLSLVDSEMGEIYSQLRQVLPRWEFDLLRREQRHWLKQRNFNCSDGDISCLQSIYERRITELRFHTEPLLVEPNHSVDKNNSVSIQSESPSTELNYDYPVDENNSVSIQSESPSTELNYDYPVNSSPSRKQNRFVICLTSVTAEGTIDKFIKNPVIASTVSEIASSLIQGKSDISIEDIGINSVVKTFSNELEKKGYKKLAIVIDMISLGRALNSCMSNR